MMYLKARYNFRSTRHTLQIYTCITHTHTHCIHAHMNTHIHHTLTHIAHIMTHITHTHINTQMNRHIYITHVNTHIAHHICAHKFQQFSTHLAPFFPTVARLRRSAPAGRLHLGGNEFRPVCLRNPDLPVALGTKPLDQPRIGEESAKAPLTGRRPVDVPPPRITADLSLTVADQERHFSWAGTGSNRRPCGFQSLDPACSGAEIW